SIVRISPDGIPSLFATTNLSSPRSLAFDATGMLYVANSGNGTIWRFASDGSSSLFASGPLLNDPYGLAFDSAGTLHVSNFAGDSVIRITPNGTPSTFLAGRGNPYGLALDSSGILFVASWGNNVIYKYRS